MYNYTTDWTICCQLTDTDWEQVSTVHLGWGRVGVCDYCHQNRSATLTVHREWT